MEEKSKDKGYILRKLFFACLYLSTFTFGGGWSIIAQMQAEFVDRRGWMTEEQIADYMSLAKEVLNLK